MSSINFDNPWLLLVAIPLLLVLVVPFFLTVRKDNRNVHNVVSCVLHVLIAVCLTFSFAGTTIKSMLMETNVYVVADVSYSTHKNLDAVDGYIQDLKEDLPLNTQLGVVCFGATDSQVVLTPLGEKLRSVKDAITMDGDTITTKKVDNTGTDIVSALRFTRKIFKGNVVKRIVLITDAKQSDESDENALKREVDSLHEAQIYVDAIYLDSNIAKEAQEVQISGVDCSDKVYEGQEVSANVLVQSSMSTARTLRVTRSFEKEGERVTEQLGVDKKVTLSVGLNSVPVRLYTQEEGEYSYFVSLLETEQDESLFNNTYEFSQTVTSKPSVLFITDSDADVAYANAVFAEGYSEVDIKNIKNPTHRVPLTVSELCKYDEIVLSDVPVAEIKNYNVFVESLYAVVTQLGKSLVGMGDLGLHDAAGDAALSKLAGMMPVRYGNPIKEERLYTIVLDVSFSMERMGKITLAKNAAKKLVDIASENDKNKIALVIFYGETEILQPVTAASECDKIKKLIDNVQTRHATNLAGGLNAAVSVLEQHAQEMRTQVFVITDGEQDSGDNWTQAGELINSEVSGLKKYGVVTSILAIRPESPYDGYMQNIVGAERYQEVEDVETLRSAFTELGRSEETYIQDRYTFLQKEQFLDDVLNDISDDSFKRLSEGGKNGYITGYALGSAKPNATTTLSAEYTSLEYEYTVNVPIYAYWECGNGKSASFMSKFGADESGRAIDDWTAQWGNTVLENGDTLRNTFFKNVFSVNTPKERVDTPFTVTISRQSGKAQVDVCSVEGASSKTNVRVVVTSPSGEKTEFNNLAAIANVYSCSFALPNVGEYAVEVIYNDGEPVVKRVHLAYLPEYDAFATFDASPLYKMVGVNGTVSEDGKLSIVNDEDEVGVRIVNLTPVLLIITVVLFVADVIVRKVKWADITGIFRRPKKGGRV